jgi:hypothetical protein
MRARLHEACGGTTLRIADMKCGTPAPFAMRINEVRYFGIETGPVQCGGDESTLPVLIRRCRERLYRAAAAICKIAAVRRGPVQAWRHDLGQCAVRIFDVCDDGFSFQGIGNKDQAVRGTRNPFAPLPKALDNELCV